MTKMDESRKSHESRMRSLPVSPLAALFAPKQLHRRKFHAISE